MSKISDLESEYKGSNLSPSDHGMQVDGEEEKQPSTFQTQSK